MEQGRPIAQAQAQKARLSLISFGKRRCRAVRKNQLSRFVYNRSPAVTANSNIIRCVGKIPLLAVQDVWGNV